MSIPASLPGAEVALRVTSYNAHLNGLRPDKVTPYDLVRIVNEIDTDVLVLQEIDTGRDLGLPHLPHRSHLAVWVGDDHESGENLGVLIHSRYPILDTKFIKMPVVGRDPRRFAIMATIDSPIGIVNVIGVHLTTDVLPVGSFIQAASLARQLPDGPLIITGDHNLWGPVVAVTGFARRGMSRAVLGRTWPAHRPHSQIDHIWYRGLRSSNGHVLSDRGSDHLPVQAYFYKA